MKRKRHTPEQIIAKLPQAEADLAGGKGVGLIFSGVAGGKSVGLIFSGVVPRSPSRCQWLGIRQNA